MFAFRQQTFANRPKKNPSRSLTFANGKFIIFFGVRIQTIKTKFEAFLKEFLGEDNNGNYSIQMFFTEFFTATNTISIIE